jgi:vancomycin permeability regulator SanA
MKQRIRALWVWAWKRKWWIFAACMAALLLLIVPTVCAHVATSSRRYAAVNIGDVPKRKVAIVFGAGVLPSGEATPYLKRRLDTAAALYKNGQVEKLLLSGDNSTSHHNEPIAMRRYIEQRGVKRADIVLDYAGFNTYDSCYRAHAIFGIDAAILVSHDYHLPRAILTCNGLGVDSVGLAAKSASLGPRDTTSYAIRELASTNKAFLQLLFKPRPTALGKPEPISYY